MTRRRKLRKERGLRRRQVFGQITYYYETGDFAHVRQYARDVYGTDAAGIAPVAMSGRVKYAKRMFPTYDDALLHVTNVKLGIKKEEYPFSKYTPCKLLGGYRHRGNKHVTMTKVLAIPPLPRARSTDNGDFHVGTRMGREVIGSGLLGQQRGNSISLSQAQANNLYDYWSGRATTTGSFAATVGTRWVHPGQLSSLSGGDGGTASSCI